MQRRPQRALAASAAALTAVTLAACASSDRDSGGGGGEGGEAAQSGGIPLLTCCVTRSQDGVDEASRLTAAWTTRLGSDPRP